MIEAIASEYGKTDSELKGNFETIKNIILEEIQTYKKVLVGGKQFIEKELGKQGTKTGDELKGTTHISADLAFKSLASYGLGPTQLKSLGYDFNEQELSEKMKEHQKFPRRVPLRNLQEDWQTRVRLQFEGILQRIFSIKQ